ncbi:CPBP family intramembrane glutamic endopeptidase [Dactylosporangium sp. NPDC051541]|uniref:CPBP family intramembrane glutamic endopeptidase n=1 Tax=Dactylosporangium sp. NPDC051541 TaxID=3363977 RepID=UPI00379EAE65
MNPIGTKEAAGPQPVTSANPIMRLVRRRPLLTFFVLSCCLAWWPAPLYTHGWLPAAQAGFGPFLAALIVLGATEGRPGVRRLLGAMVRWRVPIRAYVAAVGAPLLVSGAAIGLNLAGGAARPETAALAAWVQIPTTALVVLLIPGIGGAWEEPGFRGYSLRPLEHRFGPLGGPLLLGALWAGWHLPLFLTGGILWPDVLVIVAASVVLASVFHLGRESVLIAMLLHATNNAVGGGYASGLFHGADQTRLGLFTAAGWIVLAVVAELLRRLRPPRKGTERSGRVLGAGGDGGLNPA